MLAPNSDYLLTLNIIDEVKQLLLQSRGSSSLDNVLQAIPQIIVVGVRSS